MISYKIFGVRIDDLGQDSFMDTLIGWSDDKQNYIVTPNAEMLLEAKKDKQLKEIINNSDISLPDSISVIFAISALYDGINIKRQPGVDAAYGLIQYAQKKDWEVLALGGDISALRSAQKVLKDKYNNLRISVMNPGLVSKDGYISNNILKSIILKKPDILFVGLGHGKQEKFIKNYLQEIKTVKIAIGVGGAFDMIGGKLRRAPKLMRAFGLEWLWRLILQPSRWKRILRALIVFPAYIVYGSYKNGHLFRSIKNVLKQIIQLFSGKLT